MRITVCGILTDYQGRVLLQQTGPKTLGPIDRPLEIGALPADALARAFREDTGLIILPVRLTGLFHDHRLPGGELSFLYRCTMRGGDLPVPAGKPPAGFFDYPPLPAALSPAYRQRVEGALLHPGGPPTLARQVTGLGARLGRLLGNRAPHPEGVEWAVSVRVIAEAEPGQVVWTRSSPEAPWRLPAAAVADEAPWETAARLMERITPDWRGSLGGPALLEIAADRPAVVFTFTSVIDTGVLAHSDSETLTLADAEEGAGSFAPDDARLVEGLDRAAETPSFIVIG